ncbi:MAG: erythromycin esterase family protein [Lachnospiraceae bacterium]|nr:erythromycin esterase family protein [Lachnospiraceae bacterium]
MRSFQSKVFIFTGVFVSLIAVLLVLRTGIFNTPKRIEGIEEIAVSFDDLKIPEGTKVVGIGEATHGNVEFQEIKLQMLQKLVNEGTAHAIAFEMSPAEAALYNDAIHEGESDLTELIGGTDYPLYDTKQMVDLLTWMREYNLTHDENESVMIYGVDMQTGIRAAEYLLDFGKKHEGLYTDEEMNTLSVLVAEFDSSHPEARDFFYNLSVKLDSYDDVNCKNAAVIANSLVQLMDAPSYEKNPNNYSVHRDTCMAENLMAYYKIEQSRGYSQIIITAHNGHVMKYNTDKTKEVNMGVKINELFEGSYYCVGTEFYNTCVNVHTAKTYDEEYERANHDYCSDDLLAYQAQFFEGKVYCLDFASVDKTHKKVYNIIHRLNWTGMAGEGYSSDWEVYKSYRARMIVTDHYDAMVYYYETTPIDPIHY